MKKYVIISVFSVLMCTACSLVYDEPEVLEEPVYLSMTRAGESVDTGDNYRLLFWTGDNTSAVPGTLFYNLYSGIYDQFQPLMAEDSAPIMYPADNLSIWGIGFLPADSLVSADSYNTLTLNSSNERPVGFYDVCSTTLVEGKETAPFDNANRKFEFKHTLVKLDFVAERSSNVNARLWNICVTVKGTSLRDKWTYSKSGYIPGQTRNYTSPADDLVFTSGDRYFDDVKDGNSISGTDTKTSTDRAVTKQFFYEFETKRVDDATGRFIRDSLKYCYIAHNDPTVFSIEGVGDNAQAYITLYDFKAKITRPIGGTVDLNPVSTTLKVPLTDLNGNPWRSEVKPGDAFTIYLYFDQNKIRLWAQKQPWQPGGRLYIPLNPNDPGVEAGATVVYQ